MRLPSTLLPLLRLLLSLVCSLSLQRRRATDEFLGFCVLQRRAAKEGEKKGRRADDGEPDAAHATRAAPEFPAHTGLVRAASLKFNSTSAAH